MAELLRAPTEGYAEAIMVPPILVEQFELKHSLINMMTSDQFFGLEKDNPHDHIRWGGPPAARIRALAYKDLLRACPHHGFTKLHQLDTFYNALNPADQDSLNAAAGGNLLERRTQDVLKIIENKSKCLAVGGNTFLELRDNIQGYVSAAAVNYNQGNLGYRPPGPGSLHSNTLLTLRVNSKPSPLTVVGAGVSMESSGIGVRVVEKWGEVVGEGLWVWREFLVVYSRIQTELKCKALAYLKASINLMPLFVWKKLGLPELISTRMTLELANRAICTPTGIASDVFVPVGKFTFPADFVIVDYESDPRVPLILGRPFLQTARALIDVHGEEMILRDGDERLILNMRHDTSSYSNQPQKKSINLINVFNNSSEDFLEDLFSNQPSGNPTFSCHPELTSPKVNDEIFDSEGSNVLSEKLLDLSFTKDLYLPLHDDPLSGKIEFMLYQDVDSNLKDLIDQINLANPANNVVDSVPEMFTDEHALDYSSHLIFDEYDDDFLEIESDAKNVYDDPFDSKGEKIKESKLLIDELDLLCDFLPFEYDSFISQDFSRVDALPSTNKEDKIFNPCILIQEKSFEIITHVVQDKKLASSNASFVLEDVDPPFYEPLFFKEVPSSKMLLLILSENEEKVFKPGIHTSKKVHSSFIPELSHQGYKIFKINQIFRSPMTIFLFFCGKDTHTLAVPCLYFYPLDQFKYGGN
nr:reverse transcriptase domain-containing protein [Tanacetum cinerariifolium]